MKIYLAIPYSNIDHELSFETANREAAELMKQGHIVFSPISHSHMIAKNHDLPGNWDFWRRIDVEFINWCECMGVVCLDGWKESRGVQEEIRIAREQEKPVFYIGPVKA